MGYYSKLHQGSLSQRDNTAIREVVPMSVEDIQ